MNTDRLLTRVWDKQEKKMLYSKPAAFEDDYEYTTIATFAGHKLDYRLAGLNGDFINFATKQNVWLPYHNKDRFVPMMCSGLSDKNGKLIYEGDIDNRGLIVTYEIGMSGYYLMRNGEGFHLSHEQTVLNNIIKHIEIIGNRWENEKLMEVKV